MGEEDPKRSEDDLSGLIEIDAGVRAEEPVRETDPALFMAVSPDGGGDSPYQGDMRLRSRGKGKVLWLGGAAGLLALYLAGVLNPAVDWVSRLLVPLERPKDVSDEGYEELKTAASFRLSSAGPRFALVPGVSQEKTEFLIASNLPDGASFAVAVHPLASTLVDRAQAVPSLTAISSRGLARTSRVVTHSGSVPVKGRYTVYLLEGPNNPAAVHEMLSSMKPPEKTTEARTPPSLSRKRVLLAKSVFLGGTPDSDYEAQRRAFHEKLRLERAKRVKGLREFESGLRTLAESLARSYRALEKSAPRTKSKAGTKARKGKWASVHEGFRKSYVILAQMGAALPGADSEAFHVQGLLLGVTRLHDLGATYFTGSLARNVYETRHRELHQGLQRALGEFSERVARVEREDPFQGEGG